MRGRYFALSILSSVLIGASHQAFAQEKPIDHLKEKLQAEALYKIVADKGVAGRVVKGAPYSATATTETLQTLSDGNQIIRKNESKLYRDSEGRTRTEQSLKTIGKWTAEGDGGSLIFINDPPAGVGYSLNTKDKIAHKNSVGLNAKDKGDLDELVRFKMEAARKAELQEKTATTAEHAKPLSAIVPDNHKTEQLGKETIEGVETEHKRTTTTIPAGEIGNTLPIVIVTEIWYSPELQTTVMSKRVDPRSGETTYKLTNLSRGEPDRSLFEVPGDYKVIEPSVIPVKKKKRAQEE
jgi:hypothetical protein